MRTIHGLGNTVDVGGADEGVGNCGSEFDADVETEGGTEVFCVVEGVEGDFVEEEVCVVVPDGDVVVEGGILVAPLFELGAVSFYCEVD